MQWFYNMKIRTKLLVSFFVPMLLALVLGVFGLIQMTSIRASMVDIETNWMPAMRAAQDMKSAAARVRSTEMTSMLAQTEASKAAANKSIALVEGELKKALATYESLISSQEERALFNKIKKSLEGFYANHEKILALTREGKTTEAYALLSGDALVLYREMYAGMEKLVEFQLQGSDQASAAARSNFEFARNSALGLLAGILVVSLLLALSVSRMIARPMAHAAAVATKVAAGDLTNQIEAKSRDETGQLLEALKNMNDKLAATVGSIRATSESVAGAAGQIAAGNVELSSRTEEQAASLEQTASSMSEMTETVKQNADNARQAKSLAGNAREMTLSGRADVEAMVRTVNEVSADSAKVAEITGMIEGIAFQTNILALNAAVEAARAGEQGRGFAVVATEVRSLAQRASMAAKDIKELIEASTSKVQLSAQQAAGVNEAMSRVSVAIERASDIIGEISAASEEQSRNLEQVHQAISQIDQVTQHNAALVEESAAAAQSLQEQAVGMKNEVMFFQIDAGPASAQPVRNSAAKRAAPVALTDDRVSQVA